MKFTPRYTPDRVLRDVQDRLAKAFPAAEAPDARQRTVSFTAQHRGIYRVAAPTSALVVVTLPEPVFDSFVRFYADTASGIRVARAANTTDTISAIGVYEYRSSGEAWFRL